MTQKKYLDYPWIDSRLCVRKSKISGSGVFTTQSIKKGEIVMIWGGIEIPRENFNWEKYRERTVVPISETMYLGVPVGQVEESIDEYLNHSCDSNCWLNDEVTMVARRDIQAGEEITLDQALWNDDEDEEYSDGQKCTCRSRECRKILTGHDWKIPEVQEKYRGHFSPFISRKFETSYD